MQYPRLRSSAMLALCKLMAIDADFWSVISHGAYLELVFHEEFSVLLQRFMKIVGNFLLCSILLLSIENLWNCISESLESTLLMSSCYFHSTITMQFCDTGMWSTMQ